jgi:hypothetical protein
MNFSLTIITCLVSTVPCPFDQISASELPALIYDNLKHCQIDKVFLLGGGEFTYHGYTYYLSEGESAICRPVKE